MIQFLLQTTGESPSTQTSPYIRVIVLFSVIIIFYSILLWFAKINRNWYLEMPLVRDAASYLEQYALEKFGEREFVKRLMEFEYMAEGDLQRGLYFITTDSGLDLRLIGICWLSRKGHGDLPVYELIGGLKKVKI